MPKITSIDLRRGTTAEWNSANPILANGEITWDSTVGKFKVGNGSSKWSALAYVLDAALATKLDSSLRGSVNGVASLDTSGKVPKSQLPASQVGTSLMGTYAARPSATTTAAGTIYYATNTMESYRSNGSSWDVIAAGSELGSAELRTTLKLNSNGSWLDIPGMSVTFNAPERPIKVELTADFCTTNGNVAAQLRMMINGTVSMGEVNAFQAYGLKWDTRTSKVRWSGLIPGNLHTIKVQAKCDAGSAIWIDGNASKTSVLTVSGV